MYPGSAGTLPTGYQQQVDPSTGKAFYVNLMTGETSWSPPTGAAAAPAPMAPSAPPSAAGLPPGWEERVDPTSGRPFYINHANKSTSSAKLTRASRGLRTVRTGYAHQPPACCTYRRHGAAGAPRCVQRTRISPRRAVRTAYRGTTGCLWGVITSVSRSQVKERQPRVRPTLLEQTDIRSLRFDFAREELTLARRPLLGLDAVLSTYLVLGTKYLLLTMAREELTLARRPLLGHDAVPRVARTTSAPKDH